MKKPKQNKTKQTAGNRIFDSMKQASGALDISWDSLRTMKERGCGAFKAGGRVHEAELLKWIKSEYEKPAHTSSDNNKTTRQFLGELWEKAAEADFNLALAIYCIEDVPDREELLASFRKSAGGMKEIALRLGIRKEEDWIVTEKDEEEWRRLDEK